MCGMYRRMYPKRLLAMIGWVLLRLLALLRLRGPQVVPLELPITPTFRRCFDRVELLSDSGCPSRSSATDPTAGDVNRTTDKSDMDKENATFIEGLGELMADRGGFGFVCEVYRRRNAWPNDVAQMRDAPSSSSGSSSCSS